MGPQQDLSSPEDETSSSFHTPKHVSGTNASSMYSVLTSQESIDVFHDAFSTFYFPLPSILHSPSRKPHQRRRHFSSGARFEDEKSAGLSNGPDWEEETDEQSCMLPKDPVARVRHCSQEPCQVSRSCNCSPFHVPRLSLSTNSLKRKSIDRMSRSGSPQKHSSDEKGETGTNYVPCAEVGMIKETDEVETKDDQEAASNPMNNGGVPSHLGNSSTGFQTSNHVEGGRKPPKEGPLQPMNGGDPSHWKEHYVPCTELQTFLVDGQECQGETQLKEETLPHFFASKPIRRKKSTIQKVKEEFALSNFKFGHKTPHFFVTSQWQQPDHMCCMYLAYRLFWGVYFTMWAVWSWVGFGGYNAPPSIKVYYFIYLTNWAIWLLAVDTMLQAVNVAMHIRKISLEGGAKYSSMKSVFKTSWILSNITSTMHIFIPLMFWTTVFFSTTQRLNSISVNTHVIPCIYVILDVFVSATPRRLFHAYLSMGLLTIYGIFTDIYYLVGGISHEGKTELYPFLDWSEPSKTLLVGAGLILLLVPVLHILVVCLYGLRVKLWHNLNYPRYDREVVENVQSISMEEKV